MGRVDAHDARVRMLGAHHDRVRLSGEIDVVAVAAFAGEEPGILLANDRRSDARIGQA